MAPDPRCPEMSKAGGRAQKARAPLTQMQFTFGKPGRPNAEAVIRGHLLACLPAGVSPSFARIERATFRGQGRSRIAIANLLMVDGGMASVEVFGWGGGCLGHRYTAWEGAPLFFEGGQWRREAASDGA